MLEISNWLFASLGKRVLSPKTLPPPPKSFKTHRKKNRTNGTFFKNSGVLSLSYSPSFFLAESQSNVNIKFTHFYNSLIECSLLDYLYDYIKQHNTRGLKIEDAIYFFVQIVDGVAYMHSKRIIHKDLKGKYVLFVDDKLCSCKSSA